MTPEEYLKDRVEDQIAWYDRKSGWVVWEIDKAKELNKKLVAIKFSSGNTTPSGLLNAGASWAMSFTFDAIKKSIENA